MGNAKIHGQKGDTWPRALKVNYEKYGASRKAMRYKHYGIWEAYTWQDYWLDVKHLALGLISLGFEEGDKLLIVGDNAPQWYAAEIAAQAARGASLGIDPDLTPAEIALIAKAGRVRFAVVQDQEQVDKLFEARERLPLLEKIVCWRRKGLAHYHDEMLMEYGEALELGKSFEAKRPGLFEKNVETGSADDVCALVCTSGTAGRPKLAMHTARTLRAGADELLRLHAWKEEENVVPLLPPVWITGQWLAVGCHLLSGCTLNFAESQETAQRDAGEIGPTIVWRGARLWESQAAGLRARISGVDALTRLVFSLLIPIGYRMADLSRTVAKTEPGPQITCRGRQWRTLQAHKSDPGTASRAHLLQQRGRLSPEAMRFYHALGIPLESLYFTTEGGLLPAVAANGARRRAAAPPEDAPQARLTGAGEIVSRSPECSPAITTTRKRPPRR